MKSCRELHWNGLRNEPRPKRREDLQGDEVRG